MDDQHYINKKAESICDSNTVRADKSSPEVMCKASLAEWMSSRFNERPCFKSHGAEQLRMTCSVDLWPLQTWCTCTHINTQEHIHKRKMRVLCSNTVHQLITNLKSNINYDFPTHKGNMRFQQDQQEHLIRWPFAIPGHFPQYFQLCPYLSITLLITL